MKRKKVKQDLGPERVFMRSCVHGGVFVSRSKKPVYKINARCKECAQARNVRQAMVPVRQLTAKERSNLQA